MSSSGLPVAVNPPALGEPRGYSNGFRVPAGADLVFVAGQIGWDAEQNLSPEFSEQFKQALVNVVTVVEAAGGGPESLVSMTIYVTDKRAYLADLRALGTVWKSVIGRHYPAMALVEVTALVEDDAMVEVQAVAAVIGG